MMSRAFEHGSKIAAMTRVALISVKTKAKQQMAPITEL
jgi:hypothetical protein